MALHIKLLINTPKMYETTQFLTQILKYKSIHYYLSNITQLDWTLLASAATAPDKVPERIFTLIFMCKYLTV